MPRVAHLFNVPLSPISLFSASPMHYLLDHCPLTLEPFTAPFGLHPRSEGMLAGCTGRLASVLPEDSEEEMEVGERMMERELSPSPRR